MASLAELLGSALDLVAEASKTSPSKASSTQAEWSILKARTKMTKSAKLISGLLRPVENPDLDSLATLDMASLVHSQEVENHQVLMEFRNLIQASIDNIRSASDQEDLNSKKAKIALE